MAHVVSIVIKPPGADPKPDDRFARAAVEHASLQAGHGITGDTKGRADSRQLNVMLAETVAELTAEGFKTAPGELGEQLVVAGLPPEAATPGTRLRVGASAVIEVSYPRTGCSRFEHIQGRPREAVDGRLGFLARVVVGGDISVGSPVAVESAASGSTAT